MAEESESDSDQQDQHDIAQKDIYTLKLFGKWIGVPYIYNMYVKRTMIIKIEDYLQQSPRMDYRNFTEAFNAYLHSVEVDRGSHNHNRSKNSVVSKPRKKTNKKPIVKRRSKPKQTRKNKRSRKSVKKNEKSSEKSWDDRTGILYMIVYCYLYHIIYNSEAKAE